MPACPLARDEPRQGAAAGAGQHPEIRREGHLVDQLGHPGDGQRAAASFRYQQGVVILEPGKPFGILAPAIVLAVDKNEIHAPAFGRFQGGIADGIPFTAYDARGAQSQSESCCGQGVDVIGVGAAKGEDVALAQHLCLLQMVFELSPLVAGEGRVDQIVPLAPERDVMGCQQRMPDPVQGGGELKGRHGIVSRGCQRGRRCVVCHKVGG